VEELFARNINSSWLFRFGELAPRIANVINKTLFGINIGRVAINMYLLPLISKKQLHETPNIWLFKRLHPIIEQRQQTPTSRVDLLALMLKVMSEEAVNVSVIKIYRT
jgi:recombinational DNA repair protein (RecF pathway)